jgi:CheY-like chemotaxis protein
LIGRRAEAFRVCWFTINLKRTLTPIEILLIEDGAGDVLLFRHALEDYPRPVTLRVARDGEQALQILADPTLNLDLIILRFELTQGIRHMRPRAIRLAESTYRHLQLLSKMPPRLNTLYG